MQLNDRQQTAANILWLAAGKPAWRNLYKHAIGEADADTVEAILERGTGPVTAEQADAFIRTRDPVAAGFLALAEAAPEEPSEDKPAKRKRNRKQKEE